MIISIIAGVLTYATFVAGLSVLLISGYVLLTANGRARLVARHRKARFVAGLTTVSAPTPNKEIPMRKIIIIAGIAVAAIVGIGIAANGGSKSDAAAPPPTAAQSSEAPPEPVDNSECADVIATGDADHAATAAARAASKTADDALNAQLAAAGTDTADMKALNAATEDAQAKWSLANAAKSTASDAYTKAKNKVGYGTCSQFTGLDMQFLNADIALMQATPATQAAADQLWADALTAWDSAKAGV